MTEKEIFEKLFSLILTSDDRDGAVAACLVRNGIIIADAVSSSDGVHAEYALLKKVGNIEPGDVIYTTVEPCGSRTPGGRGEKMGDCTANLIQAGVKHVIYGASDPHASGASRPKFTDAGVICKQTGDKEIVKRTISVFNATCSNKENWLPLE